MNQPLEERLLAAAERYDDERMRMLLEEEGHALDVSAYQVARSLSLAATAGFTDVVLRLIELGADPNVGECDALSSAIQEGHVETAVHLLEHSDLRFAPYPLTYAAEGGYVELVRRILGRGNGSAELALAGALSPRRTWPADLVERRVDLIHYLLGANYGISINNGRFLFRAIENRVALPLVEALLDCGADVHADNDWVLRRAIEVRSMDAMRMLLAHGADARVLRDSPLVDAARVGNADAIYLLVEGYGADVHAQNNAALATAIASAHPECAAILLDYGAAVPQRPADVVPASLYRMLYPRSPEDYSAAVDYLTALRKRNALKRTCPLDQHRLRLFDQLVHETYERAARTPAFREKCKKLENIL